MSNILVIGAGRHPGSHVRAVAEEFGEHRFIFADRTRLDIRRFAGVRKFFMRNDAEFIVSTAAFADTAENGADLARTANRTAVKNFAPLAQEFDAKLVHISSASIFNEESAGSYAKSDKSVPLRACAMSKLSGEREILTPNLKNSIIIRTSWLYGTSGRNFVNFVLSHPSGILPTPFDQVGDSLRRLPYPCDRPNLTAHLRGARKSPSLRKQGRDYHV